VRGAFCGYLTDEAWHYWSGNHVSENTSLLGISVNRGKLLTFYPLDGATITTTPTTQIAAPKRSHLSGRNPSTMMPHSNASAMKMPP
jgi:hypothetical protein